MESDESHMSKGGRMTDIKEGNNKGNKGVVLRADRLNEDKLERSKRIGVLDIEAISRAKVLVVGLGAIGNETVKNLVLSGFTHFTLVDMDYIVRSNLNRCVFFRDIDANQKSLKTEVVGKAAKELDPDIDVTIHTAKIQDLGDVIHAHVEQGAAGRHLLLDEISGPVSVHERPAPAAMAG